MTIDLNKHEVLIYGALIHAIKSNSGIGFRNNDQGHPAYMIREDGSLPTEMGKIMGDSPDGNDLYKILHSLTASLGEIAHTPIRSWSDFCRLAYDAHRESGEV